MKIEYQFEYLVEAYKIYKDEDKQVKEIGLLRCTEYDIQHMEEKINKMDDSDPDEILKKIKDLKDERDEISRKITDAVRELEQYTGELTVRQARQFY